MKPVISRLMRADCTRDNRKTYLPGTYPCSGFNTYDAKRGDLIVYRDDSGQRIFARVIGGVTYEGKRAIEVAALLSLGNPCVRWIDPATVVECRRSIPREALAFFFSEEWKEPADIIRKMEDGFGADIRAALELVK